jgi:riboflavin synthase alpha subunit
VNLEADVIARYVARLMEARDAARRRAGVTLDLLRDKGFL